MPVLCLIQVPPRPHPGTASRSPNRLASAALAPSVATAPSLPARRTREGCR